MNIEQLVERHYDDLNDTERYIWKYIMQHTWECQNMSIAELAARCNVSHTTILRFAQKLGLQGYSELKVYLRWSVNEQLAFDEHLLESTCADYQQLMQSILQKDCTHIFTMMDQASRIFVFGTGEVQKNVAKELQRVFIFANKTIYTIEGSDETNIVTQFMNDQDVVFIISLSGSSRIVVNFIEKLKQHHVKIIAITRMDQSPLAMSADENLFITTSEHNTGKGAQVYSSMTSFFMMVDFLFLKYLKYQAKKG